ncbi:MAG: DUF5686 and carboxypeptidase-like regulatory domain-containing protein [Ignavibacteriaceae bacterium]
MIKLLYLFFLIYILNIEVYCQKIFVTGIVKDSLTGTVLPYTNIAIRNTNFGTISNREGRFQIAFPENKSDSTSYTLIFSYIGYASRYISINSSKEIEIALIPTPFQMNEVVVNSLTWAEQFILRAIAEKNKQIEELHYYSADAYAKTLFKHNSGVVGIAETISKIQFKKPNLYDEILSSYKVSANLKVMPYELVAIHQEINLLANSFVVGNFNIISPLSDNALNYYDYQLKKEALMNNDTVVIIHVVPKPKGIPLIVGDLYFLTSTHSLLQAILHGNSYVKSAYQDSLAIYQKYMIKDSLYNLPSFTKFSFRMNIYGFYFVLSEEYTFINYNINDKFNEPVIMPDKKIVTRLNKNINFNLQRTETFKVPLTKKEVEFYHKIDSVFVKGSIVKKILFNINNVLMLLMQASTDEPGTLFGYNFKKFSNIYHFNKVEGNYCGLEYEFQNIGNIDLYTKIGYAFGLKKVQYNLDLNWRNFILDIHNNIINLGNLDYLQSVNSFNALFYHEDPMNYYQSTSFSLKHLFPLSSKVILTPFVKFEKQEPVKNSTEFSLFNKDRRYLNNFLVSKYNNNTLGFSLSYTENRDYLNGLQQIYKGQSFTNLSASIAFADKKLMNSTENLYEANFMIRSYQELFYPISMRIESFYHYISKTDYINKMSFVNNSEAFRNKENQLSFYTLDKYSYYLQDYLKIKLDINLINLPKILFTTPSVGVLFSFLHPVNQNDLNTSFIFLKNNFYEYGLELKGISILNLYVLKNNIDEKNIFVKIDVTF